MMRLGLLFEHSLQLAALLTGRNNHEVGFGSIAEWSAGYAGYNTLLPKSAATIAEVLKENGYSTSMGSSLRKAAFKAV